MTWNRIAPAVALGVVVFAAGCGDDDNPVVPKESPWTSVALPDSLGHTAFIDIAFHDAHGLVVGWQYPPASAGTAPVVLETTGGDWTRISPGGLTSTLLMAAVTFTSTGDAILGGVDGTDSKAVILDQRGGFNRVNLSATGGVRALAEGGGVLRGVGTSLEGLSLLSTGADVWTADDAGFATAEPNDKGLADLAWYDGVFYACGFDDAADGSPQEPSRVVMQNDGSGWTRVPSPVEDAAWILTAVALTGQGVLLVGGTITDFSAGADDAYVAAVRVRTGAGSWSPAALPGAGDLDEVNDILVTPTGTIYLACGLNTVHILKGTLLAGFHDEGPGIPGKVERLAEGPDGVLYAAGWVLTDPYDLGSVAPVLLRRGM